MIYIKAEQGIEYQQMEQNDIKSLKKSLDILNLFRNSGKEELSLTEISKASGLSKSTISRILSTLTSCGYLQQREKRGKYALGTIYLEFSGFIKRNLKVRNVAVPYLTELNRYLEECVILSVWKNDSLALVENFNETINNRDPLQVIPGEGNRMALHATSLGKIILASMSEQELEKYFQDNVIERYTPNTITNVNDMKNHLINIRTEGVAFDDEEYRFGIRGLGAEIRSHEGKLLGAIGVVAPSVRFSRNKLRELAPTVKKCATDISAEFGFKGTE